MGLRMLEADSKPSEIVTPKPETDLKVNIGAWNWLRMMEADAKSSQIASPKPETDLKVNIGAWNWLRMLEADSKPSEIVTPKPETDLKVNIGAWNWLRMMEADSKSSQSQMDLPASDDFDWMNASLPQTGGFDFEASRGRVITFNSNQEVEAYWASQVQPGRKGTSTQ